MGTFSIKRRIVVAVAITEFILVFCLLFLATYLVQRNAIRSFDEALSGRAMSIAALVRYSEGPNPTLEFDNTFLPTPLTKDSPDLFRVMGPDGKLLASSPQPPIFPSTDDSARTWEFYLDGIRFRALRLQNVPVLDSEDGTPPASLDVTYAAATQSMGRSLTQAFMVIAFGGLLLLTISLVVSVRAVEKGLLPLSELASSAKSISADHWQLTTTPATKEVVELAPLVGALETMVETLHKAFQQQRDFTSNAAHELKTPVAITKSTLQSLLQEPRTNEHYKFGIEEALADLERLESLLHSMLRLAQAEQQTGAPDELPVVDVVGTCEAAIARLAPVAEKRRAVVSLDAPSELIRVCAEADDLEIVWSNLIENAIRYGPPGSEVKVSAAQKNGTVSVTVEDRGSGIPAADLSRIFERFQRGETSRSRQGGGYGLGLAIAKAFVERYRGSITATPIVPNGTRIRVELPVAK
jgi:signal transduction histidine kinase